MYFSRIIRIVWREQASLERQFSTTSQYGVRSLQTHVQILFLDYQFIMLLTKSSDKDSWTSIYHLNCRYCGCSQTPQLGLISTKSKLLQ